MVREPTVSAAARAGPVEVKYELAVGGGEREGDGPGADVDAVRRGRTRQRKRRRRLGFFAVDRIVTWRQGEGLAERNPKNGIVIDACDDIARIVRENEAEEVITGRDAWRVERTIEVYRDGIVGAPVLTAEPDRREPGEEKRLEFSGVFKEDAAGYAERRQSDDLSPHGCGRIPWQHHH